MIVGCDQLFFLRGFGDVLDVSEQLLLVEELEGEKKIKKCKKNKKRRESASACKEQETCKPCKLTTDLNKRVYKIYCF